MSPEPTNSRVTVIAAWCLACVLWSGTFVFIRTGVSDVAPFTFAAARLLLALAVLTPIVVASGDRARWTRDDVIQVAGAGVLLLGVNYLLVYGGAQYVPSGLVAIILASTPVFALGFGALLGTETVTVRKVTAVSCGLAGVIAIFGTEARLSNRAALAGTVALVASAACVAGAYAWMKGRSRRLAPMSMAAIQCATGLVVLAAVAWLFEDPLRASWSPRALIALGYLAIGGSVVAFWLNYWLLARLDPSVMLMMGVAEVPLAIAIGAVVLGERLPAGTLAGAAFILVGVLLSIARVE